MINVLFATPVPESCRARFDALEGVQITYKDRKTITAEDLKDVEAVLGNLPLPLLNGAENLKWLQTDSAGINQYHDLKDSVVLTNASGAYGPAISEHMIGCVLMVMKNLARYLDVQKEREFTNLGSVKTLTSSKVVSVGMGDIGSSFAQRMHAMGSTVYGVRRSIHDVPDYVEKMYTMADMDEILPECDVVALSLPETAETIRLFDEERLRKIKKGAILVNVGRGTAIVTDDLLKVMRDGHLAGACLDVTDPEPLPKNHPLWTTEHVYITPHISGRFNAEVTFDRVLDIYYDNLQRYIKGEKLNNICDRKLGY